MVGDVKAPGGRGSTRVGSQEARALGYVRCCVGGTGRHAGPRGLPVLPLPTAQVLAGSTGKRGRDNSTDNSNIRRTGNG